MKRYKLLCLLALSALLLAGCGKKETVFYLPKDQIPQIERHSRYEDLPMQEEPEDSAGVVTPFLPFDAGKGEAK